MSINKIKHLYFKKLLKYIRLLVSKTIENKKVLNDFPRKKLDLQINYVV